MNDETMPAEREAPDTVLADARGEPRAEDRSTVQPELGVRPEVGAGEPNDPAPEPRLDTSGPLDAWFDPGGGGDAAGQGAPSGAASLSDDSASSPPVGKAPRFDRGQRIALAGMGVLALVGAGLVVRSYAWRRPVAPPPPSPATLTAAEMPAAPASASGSAEPGAQANAPDAAALAVTEAVKIEATRPEPAKPAFVPAWRVASLAGSAGIDIAGGTFGKASLAAALAKVGLAKGELKRIQAAFEGVRRIEHPGAKDAFVLAKDRAKATLVAFEYVASPVDIWQVRFDDPGAAATGAAARVQAKKLELHVEHRRVKTGLSISADLAKAVAASGLKEQVLHELDEALDGHVDLASIGPGARVRFVATEDWIEGVFSGYHIDAVEYVPRSGAPMRVYHYDRDALRGAPDGDRRHRTAPHPGFYDAKGQQPYRGVFRSPVPLARITSRFNPRRMHPVLHVVMPHNGVDFGAGTGTPVLASAPGIVVSAGNSGPCGNMVEISHAGGLNTAYCHLSRFAAGLKPGQHVDARQLVGYVGQTGRATGPHLHFAVKRGGAFVDPLALKLDGVRVLPPADREVLAKQRLELDPLLDEVALPTPAAEAPVEDDKSGD